MINIKTNTTGIVQLITSLSLFLNGLKSEDTAMIGAGVIGIISAIGNFVAKDSNVTGGNRVQVPTGTGNGMKIAKEPEHD